jgi:hypothetical protein
VFFNCSYIIFGAVFDWYDNMHHLFEHWESTVDNVAGGQISLPSKDSNSDDTLEEMHKKETQFFLSAFALIRLLIIVSYLYVDFQQGPPIHAYMMQNWLPKAKSRKESKEIILQQ